MLAHLLWLWHAGFASAAALKVEPGDSEAPPAKPKAVQAPAQSPKAARSKTTASIRTAKQPAAKRKASSGIGKTQPSAKKSKVEDPHQRTLASFLASPSRPAAPSSSAPAGKAEHGAQAAAHIAHASRDPSIKAEQGVGAAPCTAPASSAPTIKAEQGVEPKAEAEVDLQAAHRAHSAAPEEGLEDPLAGISVEHQRKIERAIERAAAAKRQRQEKEAEDRVLTDPSEGGFVKQGPDPSEIAAAVPAAAVVAELSVGDILADNMPEAEPPNVAIKHEPSAGTMHSGDGQTTEASIPQEPSKGCGQHVAGNAPTVLHVPVKAEPNPADASALQAPVKLEEAGGGVSDAMLEQTADVNAEDPVVVEKQQLRQLGMFSSARSNTKGVANALIEKRKIRQRKAGIGFSEDDGSAAANGQADAAKSSEAPALAQETQKPEDGVCTKHATLPLRQSVTGCSEQGLDNRTLGESSCRYKLQVHLRPEVAPQSTHHVLPVGAGGDLAGWQACAIPAHCQGLCRHGGHHKAPQEGRDHGGCLQGDPQALPR